MILGLTILCSYFAFIPISLLVVVASNIDEKLVAERNRESLKRDTDNGRGGCDGSESTLVSYSILFTVWGDELGLAVTPMCLSIPSLLSISEK